MDALRVDARWLRKSLDRQVEEALKLIGEPSPAQRWPGGFIAGGRAFTTTELADRVLDGGAAGAEGRAETILAPTAIGARNVWSALGICGACEKHRDVAAVTSKVTPLGRVNVTVCAPCGEDRRGRGYDVVPIGQGVS